MEVCCPEPTVRALSAAPMPDGTGPTSREVTTV